MARSVFSRRICSLSLASLRLGVGDLLFQALHLDLFLGDDVHILADLRRQVLDHLPSVIDFKADGHAVLDGIVDVAPRGADIADRIPPEKNDSSQKNGCGGDQRFANHKWKPSVEGGVWVVSERLLKVIRRRIGDIGKFLGKRTGCGVTRRSALSRAFPHFFGPMHNYRGIYMHSLRPEISRSVDCNAIGRQAFWIEILSITALAA